MKVTVTLALCAVVALFATSCNGKKDWRCTCKNDTYNVTNEYSFESLKKKDAKAKCDALNEEVSGTNGVVSHMVCTLD